MPPSVSLRVRISTALDRVCPSPVPYLKLVREGFAASVTRGFHSHETRVELVLQVADENSILNERRALSGRAFVVNVERATSSRERAIVHHGDAFGSDTLADAPRKRRSALAVKIALEAVADGFV